jgi:2-polyprenyl-3-methyl-5-hydroxy-6-metoxy-1,4-benzoquinol methylase
MLKYYNYYDKSYEKFTPEWFSEDNSKTVSQYLKENSESMIDFIQKYQDQFNLDHREFYDKNVLILGCGLGGLAIHMANKQSNVVGVDVSKLAIMGAKQISKTKGLSIEYKICDICTDDIEGKFDYIIDDHLLHCLTTDDDRASYFKFVKNHLKDDTGLFILETMTGHGQFQTPVGYNFDENNILWKSVDDSNIMIRKISDSIDIENEFKNANLNINYLYYHSELAFQVFSEYSDYPFKYLPRTIRITAKC